MDEDIIAQFASITGSSPALAAQYLRLADNNTEQAIELYYANDGADLEPSTQTPHPSQAPAIPAPSTRPTGRGRGYQDQEGVVHLDSDQEDPDYSDTDDVEVLRQSRREPMTTGGPTSTLQTSSSATPPVGQATMDDDEAVARRLQEEFYGAAGRTGGGVAETLDEHGYRAPIARTTETLVGQGSFDPSDDDEMRAAVMEQLAARRQPPRHRGERIVKHSKKTLKYNANSHRSSWDLQPSHCNINMEQRG